MLVCPFPSLYLSPGSLAWGLDLMFAPQTVSTGMGEDRTSSLCSSAAREAQLGVSSGSASGHAQPPLGCLLAVGGYVAGTQMGGCLPSYLVILDMALPAGNTQATGEGPHRRVTCCVM